MTSIYLHHDVFALWPSLQAVSIANVYTGTHLRLINVSTDVVIQIKEERGAKRTLVYNYERREFALENVPLVFTRLPIVTETTVKQPMGNGADFFEVITRLNKMDIDPAEHKKVIIAHLMAHAIPHPSLCAAYKRKPVELRPEILLESSLMTLPGPRESTWRVWCVDLAGAGSGPEFYLWIEDSDGNMLKNQPLFARGALVHLREVYGKYILEPFGADHALFK